MKIGAPFRSILALVASPAIAAGAGGAPPAPHPAPTPAAVSRIELEHSNVPGTDMETRIYLITFAPGTAAPLHHHPVEGIGYIVEGKARSAFGTDAPVTLFAGQGFRDQAMTAHTVFANADARKPLKFLVAYTVRKGTPVMEVP
ncbi:cupin domain-containing protein [Rhodanobacter sp. 7MK24]|uniref:cupin domain-containing protein n=1 Tax=Rhodanobacter sp. 7MK24 TaxID=2775922 RepID=UPI00177CC0C0|nr:cupin domain-containing protein [Rhodanobacter sp. 7MK24]MBD8879921.1 cupin domain-containing protein [Rhodanobacter sp. 7MK24]